MTKIHTSFEVFALVKSTNAAFFKNLRTGSKIKISVEIEKSWQVTHLKVENLDSKETISKGIGELSNCLKCFQLNEIKED